MSAGSALTPAALDLIYFGSLPVAFAPVAGAVVPFVAADWAADGASAARVAARAAYLAGDDGARDVVLPAVPSLDFACVRAGGERRAADAPPGALPPALAAPLLKVPLARAPAGALRGVASGTRSALAKVDGAWFRLKGCGNNDEGFRVRVNPRRADGVAWRDIRGSAFPKEALTELLMADRVARALAARGAAGANGAVAFARYAAPAELPLGPRFETACIVESTLGDRRLGTHVLAGLEALLPSLLCGAAGAAAALAGVFPPARPRGADGAPEGTESFVEMAVLPVSAAYACEAMEAARAAAAGAPPPPPGPPLENAEPWSAPGVRRDASSLADLCGAAAPAAAREWLAAAERAGVAALRGAPPPEQWTREGRRPMAPEWVPVWAAAVEAVRGGGGGGGARRPRAPAHSLMPPPPAP